MAMWYFLALMSVLNVRIEVNADTCIVTAPEGSKENLTVAEAFRNYKIVGDYLKNAPPDLLEIKLSSNFNNNCKGTRRPITLMPGDFVSPFISFQTPEISYPRARAGSRYTLMLLNIDAPSQDQPTDRAFVNGLFVNSPGRKLLGGDLVVPYTAATPALGTGLQRYIFIVYKQKKRINADAPNMWRLARYPFGFSAEDFAEQNNLQGPVAGNFVIGEVNTCSAYQK